jgi:hypothetical protein
MNSWVEFEANDLIICNVNESSCMFWERQLDKCYRNHLVTDVKL